MAPVRHLTFGMLLALACWPAAVSAQDAASTSPPEAVELFRTAREHYQGGSYRLAAEDLERAQMLDPASATLAYNLARVYELLGSLDRALEQYGRYVRLLGEGEVEERERTEATIRRLEGARRAITEQVEQEPLRELVPVVIVRERGVADVPFWTTLGAGAALLAGGAALGALALVQHEAARDYVLRPGGSVESRQGLQDEAQLFGAVADASFAAGGVALTAALLLFILRERVVEQGPSAATAGVELGVGPGSVHARWSTGF